MGILCSIFLAQCFQQYFYSCMYCYIIVVSSYEGEDTFKNQKKLIMESGRDKSN